MRVPIKNIFTNHTPTNTKKQKAGMLVSLKKSIKRFFFRLINVPVNLVSFKIYLNQKRSIYFRVGQNDHKH